MQLKCRRMPQEKAFIIDYNIIIAPKSMPVEKSKQNTHSQASLLGESAVTECLHELLPEPRTKQTASGIHCSSPLFNINPTSASTTELVLLKPAIKIRSG